MLRDWHKAIGWRYAERRIPRLQVAHSSRVNRQNKFLHKLFIKCFLQYF